MHLTPNPSSQSHTIQSQLTTKPSQMPAPVMAWQLSSATSGAHGGSANTGTTMDETSGGQRALPSNYLSTPYSQLTSPAWPLTVYCNNQGVIEGWKKGRSKNTPTNAAFRRIHALLVSPPCCVFMRYIPSVENPANGLFHGQYPPTTSLLPWFPISKEIHDFILDFDDPKCNALCI